MVAWLDGHPACRRERGPDCGRQRDIWRVDDPLWALLERILRSANEHKKPGRPPPGHPDRHPPRRWVVKVANSRFNRFRWLLTRTEKWATHSLGFCHLAAVLIINRKVRHVRRLSG